MESSSEKVSSEVPEYTISKWVELIGTGRYQVYVSILMGMISFADTAEITVTSIILPNLVCEWGLTSLQKALIPGMILSGEAVGSFIAGKVADSHGRRSLLITVFYIIAAASIVSIFANSYLLYICARTIAAGGIGASYPIASCYVHEFSVTLHRSTGITIFQMIGAVGGIYTCVCALCVMSLDNGWRIELALVLIPTLVTLVVLNLADESPRYYAVHAQEDKAMVVLKKMADTNGVELVEGRVARTPPFSNSYTEVYQQPYTRVAIILSILHFSNMYVLNGLFYFIPDAMQYGYCNLSELFVSTYTNADGCSLYTADQYIFYLILNLLYFPGYALGGATCELLGRKMTVIYTTWSVLTASILVLFCIHYVITMALLLLMFMLLASLIVTLWIFGPESYPTNMRATSLGVLNTINRLGAAAGAFTTEYVDPINLLITLSTYVAVMVVAAVAALFVTKETRGTLLVDQEHEGRAGYGTLVNSEENESGLKYE